MKLKLLITLENGNVASQDVISQWSIEREGFSFFDKLHSYMNSYIKEYSTKNTIDIVKLECFDENDLLLAELNKNE
jgi:hypothetical protein